MAYEIKLNNKTFKAIDATEIQPGFFAYITLPLKSDSDVIFFQKWQSMAISCKEDYCKDVEFIKITEKGILKNCFPVINENETKVRLYFDYKIVNL